jgi:hypothetical protein
MSCFALRWKAFVKFCAYSANDFDVYWLILRSYPNRKTRVNDLEPIHTFVLEMSTELRDWHQNLPSALTVDDYSSNSQVLPHVLQLQ